MVDMTRVWKRLDDEVANTPMPEEYSNFYITVSSLGPRSRGGGGGGTCKTIKSSGFMSLSAIERLVFLDKLFAADCRFCTCTIHIF